VDARDDLRTGEVEQVRIALDVTRVVAEALAAPLLLGQPAVLEQNALRAVENGDPLGEECFELFSCVLQTVRLPVQGLESRLACGSLGVW